MENIRIAIGADHAGFEYKKIIVESLAYTYDVEDFGTHSLASVDYPDFAHPVAMAVSKDNNTFGILICGSANGVAMAANKHGGVRAAVCWTEEIAMLARKHNNANILCVPSRFVSIELAEAMVKIFLTTPFGGGRHELRVRKIRL